MRSLLYLFLICLLSGSLALPAWANAQVKAPLTILSSSSKSLVKPKLHCSKAFTLSDTLEQVVNSDSSLWYQVNNAHLNRAFNTQPIWCQFRLNVETTESWLLGFFDPNINNIELYFSPLQSAKQEAGSNKIFSDREVKNRYFYFSVPKYINSEQHIFFRLQSLSLNAPIHLVTDKELTIRIANRQSLSAMAFGFLFPLLLSFFATRKLSEAKKNSLRIWSVGIALSYTATSTAVQGYGFQFMWRNAYIWNTVAPLIFLATGLAILWCYLDAFHGKLNKLWNYVFGLSIITTLLFSAAYLLNPNSLWYHLGLAFVIINSVTILARHLYFLLKTNDSTAGKFWVGWMLLAGLCLCQSLGLLHLYFDIELIMAFAFSGLVILLGSDVYRLIQASQQQFIKVLEEQVAQEQHIAQLHYEKNNALEEQVAERTKELDRMMRELHLSNMRLRTASHTDALTGILNRYAVEHYLEEQWQRCLKNEACFGVGFVDADHFKNINDTYGHDAGDVCLKHLAQLITHSLNQVDMRVARYGGEEFIIIAPDMNATTLFKMLDELRQQLATTPIIYQGENIQLTVSIGIAAQKVTSKLHNRELIKQADTALYHAKNTGRNRVVRYSDLTTPPPKKP